MTERRFVHVDFTHMNRAGCLRLYEAGHTYALPRGIAHAATKCGLIAKQRPPGWVPPNMFQLPKVLTEAEVTDGIGVEGPTASCPRVRRSRGIGHQPWLLRPDQTLASPVQLV